MLQSAHGSAPTCHAIQLVFCIAYDSRTTSYSSGRLSYSRVLHLYLPVEGSIGRSSSNKISRSSNRSTSNCRVDEQVGSQASTANRYRNMRSSMRFATHVRSRRQKGGATALHCNIKTHVIVDARALSLHTMHYPSSLSCAMWGGAALCSRSFGGRAAPV